MGFNEKEISELKKKIQKMIDELVASREALQKAVQPIAPDSSLGRLTRMEAIADKEMAQAQLERNKGRELSLKRALKKIEKGVYGVCEDCEEWISFARLKSLPDVNFCVECA